MKDYKYIFLLLIVLGFLHTSQAQQRKRIQIEYSGFGDIDQTDEEGNIKQTFTRDDKQQIHIVHDGVDMFCDQAIYYPSENFIEAYGNVNMKQGDSINMNSKYAEYSGRTKLAFASGDVILTEPNSTLTTDTLYFDRVKQQAFYQSKGKVVRDTSGTITSQIGRYYMNSKKYQFIQNVHLVNPEYTIDSDRLDFYTETGHAYLYGPTTINSKESKIYCEKGFYNTNNDTGYFVKKSRIDYDKRIFEGDSMYFDRGRSFASANNNIKVTDTTNKSIVKGHYAEVYRAKDSVFITKRAVAITVQENDSVYIHSDTIMVTGKPEHRITRAFRNAIMYKSDMSGKADSLHIDHKTGLSQLINFYKGTDGPFSNRKRPILWNLSNQMTGDTINIKSNPETEKLDSLIVFDNAFSISKDTLGDGYNQIKGQKLIALFDDENQIKQIDIIKNAESIYYIRNDEGELIGIDKSKSGTVSIFIKNNAVEEIRRLKDPDAEMSPESKFPEKGKILRGFDWREEERPKSVEDIFKDDPPLELPIIKGMEDPLDETEFFDDKLMDRIENSQKEEDKKQGKENKAIRTLPKEIIEQKINNKDSVKTNNKQPIKKPQALKNE